MGRLADLAGAKTLTGKVTVTDAKGFTTEHADEATADKAIPPGAVIKHRRGAFFIEKDEPRIEEAPATPSKTKPPKK